MKRRSLNTVKIIHGRRTFANRYSFSPKALPTKRQMIEANLHLYNFRTLNAAKNIAKEIFSQ